MRKKDVLTKILAIAGTILVWLPVLALVIITGAMLVQRGEFHFDYLIPAELFPVFLGGGLLLLWAANRAKCYRRWIGAGLGAALVFLFAGQAAAVATGLASGTTKPVDGRQPWCLERSSSMTWQSLPWGRGESFLYVNYSRSFLLEIDYME